MPLGIKDFTTPLTPSERAERTRWRIAERLDTLAHNLAFAGGLCEAFKKGTRWPYYLNADDPTDDYTWSDWGRVAWRPGCNLTPTPSAK
jgi:hypothetical protein